MTSSTPGHDWEGRAHGEFAVFVDECREWSSERERKEPRTFHSVRYDNESKNRMFPLRDCTIEGGEIRGQAFWMVWTECTFKAVDFSHTRGIAHWTQVRFEKVNFHHLMADITAAQTAFRSCKFGNIVLDRPVFLQCKFAKSKISGALIGATFIDCEFEDVDLEGSRWEDPKMLDIRGTWRNAEQIWETSSPKAKAFFMRKPIETFA